MPVTWTLALDTDISSATITNTPGASGSTMYAGAYKDWYGCWFVSGGVITGIPITSGGSLYTAPTLTGLASTGASSRKIAGAGTLSVSGGAITAAVLSNMGRDMPTAPTCAIGSPGSGVGGVLGTPTISGKIMQGITGGASNATFGANGYLTYTGTVANDQRMVGTFINTASTDAVAINLRCTPGSLITYSFYVRASTGAVTIFYFNNYNGTTGSTQLAVGTFGALTVGHVYTVDASAIGTSLSVTLSDIGTVTTPTAPSVVGTVSVTDATLASGSMGVGLAGNGTSAWYDLKAYVVGDLILSPGAVGLNIVGQVVNVTAIGTTWNSVAPVFSSDLGTITAQSVIDDTHATFTISTGAVAGNATITDATSAKTGQLSLLAQVAPPASVPAPANSVAPVISATTYATYGIAPFRYRLYSSANSAFVVGDGSDTLVSTQTGVADTVLPTPVTDSTPIVGSRFYRWYVTDSAGQSTQGAQVGVAVPAVSTTPVKIGFMGDSITLGHDNSFLIQSAVDTVVGNPGSGYTTMTIVAATDPQNTAGHKPTFVPVLSGGTLLYFWASDPGWGFTTETAVTCTVTGDGTGATATFNPGGGYPLALQNILRAVYGYTNVTCLNAARGGTSTAVWTPHGTGSSGNTGYLLERAKATFGASSVCPVICLMLGQNDAIAGFTKATYKSNLVLTLDNLTGLGYKVVLLPPTYRTLASSSEAILYLLQQYGAACQELAAAYGGQVVLGNSRNFETFLGQQEMLFTADGLHLNDWGETTLAGILAPTVAPLLGLPGASTTGVSRPWSLTDSGMAG